MAMVLSPVASKQAVRILTLFKCGYWLLVLTALLIQPSMNLASFRSVNQRWPRAGEPTFASHFATWDTAHYLNLSEVGYSRGEPSCAFYPFWPLLVRWLSFLTGGSHLVAGLLLANACSLAAWILFHRLVARRWGNTAAHWSLAFLILFPGSLFFQFHYTEGLFLLLTMALWWGLETQRHAWGFLAAFLLPLTRAVGVSILPIAARVLGPSAPWFKSWFEQIKLGIGKPSYGTPGDYRVPPNPGELSTPACCIFPWRAVSSRAWLLAAPLADWGVYLALMWQ
jgi:hypothetical protein